MRRNPENPNGSLIPDTPETLIAELQDSVENDMYFEICPEDAAVLLEYILSLPSNSK